MPMKPHKGESQSDFMARCVPEMKGDGKRPQEQAVAACITMFKDKDKTDKSLRPDDGESRAEFMERCYNETGDEDSCALAWDERSTKVLRKTHISEGSGLEFVLSDATPDRMGDVIEADGWTLNNFKRNPIALFNHNPNFPIGKWINLRNADGKLSSHLQLAKRGTSERIDEIISLVEQDILRAVSVGFLPIKSEPLTKGGGVRFRQTELVECSLVSIPANPNALAVARSLNISPSTAAMVFAEQGNRDRSGERRGFNGGQAENPPVRKNRTMSPLTKRIEDTQQRLVRLRDELTAHLENVDDENVTDTDLATTQEFNKKIADQEASLTALMESELKLKTATNDGEGGGGTRTIITRNGERRPFNLAPKKIDPIEFLVRAGTVRALARSLNLSVDDARIKAYGDDETTKMVCDLTLKAATAPAMTTVTGWAAELVQQINAGIMESLMPAAVYPSLSALGLRLTFGRNGRISVPTRSATPTIAGSFVGEGAPIPVRQAAFTAQLMTPKKMAVITTWTREMDEHSVPAIEGLLRNAIQEDTAISIDSILLDANPATAIRPAGLRNGVTGLVPTAGGGFNALVGDLKALSGAILTATNGNVRNLVYIMNPQQALSIAFTQPAVPGGLFPFAAEINNGRLNGQPVIKSGTVPLGTVICMDAADYVSVTGDTPRFEISDQATLHMEDTAPAHIGTAGTPAVVSAPVVSMFQTDSMALRLILPMNWAVRRAGTVAWVAGVTW
jgi:HK97 family phage prohead protease/HK97 family phage major capsid protein